MGEVQFLKEKICSVVVELIKSEITTKWNGIVQFLVQAVDKDSDQAELILIALRTFIDEMHTLPKNKSKVAVNNVVDESSKTLLPYIYYQLNKAYTYLVQSKQNMDNPNLYQLSVLLINASLKVLLSISEADWTALEYVFYTKFLV